MSLGIDPSLIVIEQREEKQQKQHSEWVIKEDPFSGPRPWCRVCQAPAPYWRWTHYAQGFWGLSVRCHGKITGGLVTDRSSGNCIIEVFCTDDPHNEEGFWFVGANGMTAQESQRYIKMTIKPGLIMPIRRYIDRNIKAMMNPKQLIVDMIFMFLNILILHLFGIKDAVIIDVILDIVWVLVIWLPKGLWHECHHRL